MLLWLSLQITSDLIYQAVQMALSLGDKLLDTTISVPLRGRIANLVSVINFENDCLDQSCPAFLWAILVCYIAWSVKLQPVQSDLRLSVCNAWRNLAKVRPFLQCLCSTKPCYACSFGLDQRSLPLPTSALEAYSPSRPPLKM